MDTQQNILTVGHDGSNGFIVTIETITRRGIFQFDIIGLANKTISESKQRILSAVSSISEEKRHYINKKITTLLSPADSKKEGSHFDLPIAISYLLSVKKINSQTNIFSEIIILGELNLSGSILPIKNISALIRIGIQNNINYFIVPEGNRVDLNNFSNINIWYIKHIYEITTELNQLHLKDRNLLLSKFEVIRNTNKEISKFLESSNNKTKKDEGVENYLIDSIEGNTNAKRALEIALAGNHHILLIGSPGCGKSLLAKAAKELIPPLTNTTANIFQIEKFDSFKDQNIDEINFREPHHTSSYSEIIGNKFITGEIVLAHNGILFLDELPEFNRRVTEALRQPLENKYIQKDSLKTGKSDLIPTDFILIACMNPCDCGYSISNKKKCHCTQGQLEKYKRKMNSPLYQRFDICIYINEEDSNKSRKLKGDLIKENITRVRMIQNTRLHKTIKLNEMKTNQNFINKKELALKIDSNNMNSLKENVRNLFDQIIQKFNYSKREQYSLIRLSRTIADLEHSNVIDEHHLLEALSYKNKNNM